MNPTTWSVQRLHTLDDWHIEGLADVMIDCVEGGASVSFMHPLSPDRARSFWREWLAIYLANRPMKSFSRQIILSTLLERMLLRSRKRD